MSNENKDGALPSPWGIENQAFWDAAAQGRLLIKACEACGKVHFYPRANCPFCWSGETTWQAAQGTGAVYSFTVMRKATPPFILAYITLDEGVTLLSNIIADDIESVRIGDRVRVAFEKADDGQMIPVFLPMK